MYANSPFVGTADMLMSVTIGSYMFETGPTGRSRMSICDDAPGGLCWNSHAPPADVLRVDSEGVVQKAGPDLGPISGSMLIELDGGSTSAFTSADWPESLPPLELFQTRSFHLSLGSVDVWGSLVSGPGPATALPVAVAHWKLDESGGSVAHEETGDHHGNAYGSPVWQPSGGKLGGALLFDGINDYVDCGTFNPSAATGQLTVCLWAKWNGLNGSYQGLIGKRDSFYNQQMMWQIEATNVTGNLTFKQSDDPGIGASAPPIGQWMHVAATFDGTTARLYLNGIQSSSAAFSLGSGAAAQVVFGACEKNGGNPFNGALDDVRLYDEALSDEQIQAVMAGGVAEPTDAGPEPGGLLAHWALDEASGRIAYDGVGGFDGFLIGGPLWQPSGGKVGGALDFDGSDDVVATDFVLNPADGPFSVFAWVRGGASGGVILSQEGSAGGVDWLLADSAGGRLKTDLAGGTGRLGGSLSSTKVITDGRWHEVGFVWDGANRTLYVDGVAVAEDKQTQLGGSTGGMNIGAGKNLDAGTYWSGLIDDVRIYNGAVKP
jgi:hypothetical protein